MAEQATFTQGGVTFPLPLGSVSGNTMLRDADPALYYALGYFASVLQTYIGPRLVADAAGILGGPNALKSAVAYQLPYDPQAYLQEQQLAQFPLLAVWRERGKFKWQSVARDSNEDTWKIVYVLPPLTSSQREKLGPILAAVPKVLLNRIENMRDPGYLAGAEVWKLAGVQEIALVDDSWGSYDLPSSNLVFPAWMGSLYVAERENPMPRAAAGGKWSGIDVEMDLAAGGAPLDTVDFQVNDPDPTTIATLEVLYRGDQGLTLDSTGALVVNWSDQSGHGYSATPLAPANRPFLTLDPDSNQKTVRFDGAQTYLTATDAALAADTGKTIVVAFRLWDTSVRSFVVGVTDTTANGTVSLEANTLSSAGGVFGLYAGGSSFDTQFPTDTNWHVAVIRISSSAAGGSIAATTTVQIDNLPAVLTLKSGTGLWNSLGAASTFSIGALSSNLAATAARASVGVAMAFSSQLSTTNTATATAFCNAWIANLSEP